LLSIHQWYLRKDQIDLEGRRGGFLPIVIFFFPEKVISFRLLRKLTGKYLVNLEAGKNLEASLYYPDLINSRLRKYNLHHLS